MAGRAFFALLALLGFAALVERGGLAAAFRSIGWWGLGFAVCLAVSSGMFILALNHTTVANVLFMQAASPIFAALIARVALGEIVSRRSGVAMAVALAGVGLMVGGPGGNAIGIASSFVMMLAFAVGIVIARHRSDISMLPATCIGQLLIVLCAAPLADFGGTSGSDLGLLVALGVAQMGVGLAFLTIGARLIPAAEVALITLLEVVLGPVWVWFSDGERPAAATLAGGLVVVIAVAFQTVGGPRARMAR
jgi:drug/metabolite transporter (DMT)-like permease